MDCSLPGSSVHGILQARVLEWGAIAFSKREGREVPKGGDISSNCSMLIFVSEFFSDFGWNKGVGDKNVLDTSIQSLGFPSQC